MILSPGYGSLISSLIIKSGNLNNTSQSNSNNENLSSHNNNGQSVSANEESYSINLPFDPFDD